MDLYNIYNEGALVKAERDKLDNSDFGLPSTRDYPIHDEEHIRKAMQLFKHCKEKDRKELAYNIYKKSKDYNITISSSSLIFNYLPESVKSKLERQNKHLSESTSLSIFLLEYNQIPINKQTITEYENNCPYLKTIDLEKQNGLLLIDKHNNVNSYFITNKNGWLTDINIDNKNDENIIIDEVLKNESFNQIKNIRINKNYLTEHLLNILNKHNYYIYSETENYFFFDDEKKDTEIINPFNQKEEKKPPRKARLSDFDKLTLNEKNFNMYKKELPDELQKIDLKNYQGYFYANSYTELGEELVAYLFVETKKNKDNSKWIKYVWVKEEYRKIELCKQLLETAIYEFNAYNICISRNNGKFIDYCEKFGFKISKITDFDISLTLKDEKILNEIKDKKSKEED